MSQDFRQAHAGHRWLKFCWLSWQQSFQYSHGMIIWSFRSCIIGFIYQVLQIIGQRSKFVSRVEFVSSTGVFMAVWEGEQVLQRISDSAVLSVYTPPSVLTAPQPDWLVWLLCNRRYLQCHHHPIVELMSLKLARGPHYQLFWHEIPQTSQHWGKCQLLHWMGLSSPSCKVPQPTVTSKDWLPLKWLL